eukprot:TRINITY_DN3370_c1_g2_i2.p1 TRINITY_DN3370_c1_g2~~TRINITY_DN3370_c1_g2_i2.p1  ORF type:complete len:554 (-),score=111.63 TRINITY_DN3370_c1_g2_i2:1733-3394(-)
MATVSDSSSALEGFNRPRPRRSLSSRNQPSSLPSSSSPWSQIIRSSSDSDAIPAAIQIPPLLESNHNKGDCSYLEDDAIENCDGNGNAGGGMKKQAWNKPSNEVVEVGNVMGASSWPPLSESARASPKSLSSDSLKALGEGSVAASASTPSSSSQGPVIPSSPKDSNSNNTNHNSSPKSPSQKPANRRGGHTNHGGFRSPPSMENTQSSLERPDFSPRDFTQKNNNWEIGSQGGFGFHQPHAGSDNRRSSFRRGNGGGHQARGGGGGGDGSYQNSYGSRRSNQDRSNFEWNPHQNFSGRDIHMRHQRPGSRGFVRQAPPAPPPFISPLPVRAYAAPMGFPDMRSPLYYVPAPPHESIGGVVPYVTHAAPPGVFMSAPDAGLRTMLVKQIDYYFSSENLCKDVFLRQNMDEQGWVPISLIASFNRVKQLTVYFPAIVEAVRSSTVVEVQGDKIRKRNDWMNWLLPPPNLYSAVMSSPQSPNYDALVTQMQNVGLEGASSYNTMHGPVDSHTEGVLTRSSSGQPNRLLQGTIMSGISNGEEKGQTIIEMGPDRSI